MLVDSRRASGRRFLGAALVVFVFVLALGAKLALYDPPHPGAINPAAASKLWVNGEKLETAVTGALPVLWLTALLFLPPVARCILRLEPGRAPAARHLGLRELYRFLRPPPAF
jgi:hypothetical protein